MSKPERVQELIELARNERAQLHRHIMRKIRSDFDSEDIVQQTFKEALVGIESFRGESQLKTWVYGIANILVKNHLRKTLPNSYMFESDDCLENEPSLLLNPQETLEEKQMLAEIETKIGLLPAEIRNTLLYVLDGGHSYSEAAEHFSIPIGTIRSRVARGREILRAQINMEVSMTKRK